MQAFGEGSLLQGAMGNGSLEKVSEHGQDDFKARQLGNVVRVTTLVLNIPLSGRTSSLAVNLIPFPSCTET